MFVLDLSSEPAVKKIRSITTSDGFEIEIEGSPSLTHNSSGLSPGRKYNIKSGFCREGGGNGLFITPKFYKKVFLLVDLTTLRTYIKF